MNATNSAVKLVDALLAEQARDNRYVGALRVNELSFRDHMDEFKARLVATGLPVVLLWVDSDSSNGMAKFDRRYGLPRAIKVTSNDELAKKPLNGMDARRYVPLWEILVAHPEWHTLLVYDTETPHFASFALLGPRPALEKVMRLYAADQAE
jgi:hypothetical protein